MGVLDDAIREHLDLKRRRGADPAEIERAEREALGPVRREFDDDAAPGEVAVADAEGGENVEPGSAAPPLVNEHPDRPAEPEHEGSLEPSNGSWGEPRSDFGDDDGSTLDAVSRSAPEPGHDDLSESAASTTASERDANILGRSADADVAGDTVEFDVEGSLEVSGEAQDDVLEETPEFLQDAPDHDRLWFEQRPPRDFDFDS